MLWVCFVHNSRITSLLWYHLSANLRNRDGSLCLVQFIPIRQTSNLDRLRSSWTCLRSFLLCIPQSHFLFLLQRRVESRIAVGDVRNNCGWQIYRVCCFSTVDSSLWQEAFDQPKGDNFHVLFGNDQRRNCLWSSAAIGQISAEPFCNCDHLVVSGASYHFNIRLLIGPDFAMPLRQTRGESEVRFGGNVRGKRS